MSMILIALLVVPLLLVLPGLTLKGACAVAGPKVPSLWTALGMAILNALATFVAGAIFALTVGLVLGLISAKLAAIAPTIFALLFSGFVYSGMLRCKWSQGIAVAFVHSLLNAAAAAVLYGLWNVLI